MNSAVSYQTWTLSPQKGWFYLLQWKPFKNDNLMFKALSVLKIFKFLLRDFR